MDNNVFWAEFNWYLLDFDHVLCRHRCPNRLVTATTTKKKLPNKYIQRKQSKWQKNVWTKREKKTENDINSDERKVKEWVKTTRNKNESQPKIRKLQPKNRIWMNEWEKNQECKLSFVLYFFRPPHAATTTTTATKTETQREEWAKKLNMTQMWIISCFKMDRTLSHICNWMLFLCFIFILCFCSLFCVATKPSSPNRVAICSNYYNTFTTCQVVRLTLRRHITFVWLCAVSLCSCSWSWVLDK